MYIKLLSLLTLATLAVLPAARAANRASDKGSPIIPIPGDRRIPNSIPRPALPPGFSTIGIPLPKTRPKPIFFIDKARGAWGLNVPANIDGTNNFNTQGYDAAWISFTGDGYLHTGQTFTTTVFFTVPGPYYGPYGTVTTPTEGIDFMANSATVPSQYDSFGHQVIGIYLGPSPSGPVFTLAVHPSVSDEKAASLYADPPET